MTANDARSACIEIGSVLYGMFFYSCLCCGIFVIFFLRAEGTTMTTYTRTSQICILNNEKRSFARFAGLSFIFVYFCGVLFPSMM